MEGSVPPDSQATVNGLVQADVAKNRVAVHTFDPDTSPQEKAAEAGKGAEQLKGVNDTSALGDREVPIDTGNAHVVPTITIHDVDKVASEEARADEEEDDLSPPPSPMDPQPPGAMPAAQVAEIPDWYKVGWRAVSGIDQSAPKGAAKHKAILEEFINEQFYGDWYHNCAIIVVTVIVTHFMTRFNFGWGWLFIVLAFCNTYYSTSMGRFRERARDDIQRELTKTRLMSETETADWINHFLDRFWLIYEPVLSKTIISTVEQVLSTNTPAFLDSLRMTTFTLGSKAPRIVGVKTWPRTEDDIVMMDWKVTFAPNDTSDLTQKQAQAVVNPKIVLQVRVGKGVASVSMPILLEDMSFSGHMRIRMKLMTNFPHIQVVDLSFMEKPVFDYVLKPIGGETFGFDIGIIPGLSAFIRDMVHSILGPMMYDPNVFTLNLEQMLSGAPLDSAIGVLQVTVHSALGLKGSKIGGGTPDPFVSLSISNRAELARTKYRRSTTNPHWGESKFILVNSLTEALTLKVFDYNGHRRNTELGSATFDLTKLQEDATQEGNEVLILKEGKDRGLLRFDVMFYPVLKPQVDQSGIEELPETSVGIVRLTLHQAKDLDSTKSSSGELNPFARVYLTNSSKPIHTTPRLKHTNNPVWESPIEFLCSDRHSSLITIKVIDDRDFLKDPVVGYMTAKLDHLLEAKKEAGRDWWPLSGCKSGKLRLSAEWKPLNMAGSLHGVDQYIPPIGVVRLWLQKATDVKNVEAALGGKSDPYVRVLINNIVAGRTEVVNNNLNPEWDQIIYIPGHTLRETMLLECMDYQHLTKDRSLGYVELKVADLAQATEDKEKPYISTGKKLHADPIKLDRNSFKGQLHYEAEFVPAIPVKGLKFNKGMNALKRASQAYSTDAGTVISDDTSSISSSDEEYQAVPEGITTTAPLQKARHHQKSVSVDTTGTALSGQSALTTDTKTTEAEVPDEVGLDVSTEELLDYESGIIICNVLSGRLQRKARLEMLLDDGYWPAFSTVKSQSTNAEWEYIGEGFVKEIDFGRVWLRLNVADEGERDEVIGEWKGDVKVFLTQSLEGPTTFTLTDRDDDEKTSTVVLESRYLPVPIMLEPRESVNNQGMLRVDLINGEDIHASDRSGKSDPFAVFTLNGQKVYKSATKKKTLKPEWNEVFTVQVPSRVGAQFWVEIFDWNQIEQAKSLGRARIDLEDLEPFESVERVLQLQSDKHGNKGQVRIRMVFSPEIVMKERKATSTFSTAGRAATQIGHIPVSAGRGVVHGVTGVFRRDKAKGSTASESEEELERTPTGVPKKKKSLASLKGRKSLSNIREQPSIPDLPAGVASQPISGGATLGSSRAIYIGNDSAVSSEPGVVRVTVLNAKDLMPSDVKPYVTIRVGDKEYKTKHVKGAAPEWNETFTFVVNPSYPTLYAWVHDHKTLGRDKLLGSAEVDIWHHIKKTGPMSADIFEELTEGQGLLRLRLEYDPEDKPPRASVSSSYGSPAASPSRFSLARLRDRENSD
ncbi:tricalbin [Panus rudis PR-1116 ss-1]|nr:tricalbin [Panus rudis PR-1116 ss-1]